MVQAPIKRAVMTENKKFTHDMCGTEATCHHVCRGLSRKVLHSCPWAVVKNSLQ